MPAMRKLIRPSTGHILDIDALEIADQYLSLAHNVNTRRGFPSRINGRRICYPVSGGHLPNDPYHLLNVDLNTFNWWLSFSTATIYAVEGTNSYNITPAAMHAVSDPWEWTSCLLNGLPVFSNGRDPLYYFAGSGGTPAAMIPGWDATTAAQAVCAFRYHLFAMNIDGPAGVFDNLVMWSDAAEPGTLPASWTPSASNEAGSAILADTPGRCICGLSLGPQLLVYKPTSVYAFEYAGQQPDNIFTVRPVNRSLGALGPHCVLDLGTKHLILGNDDVVLTDGINTQSIAEDRVKINLASAIDEDYAQNAFAIRDLYKREVWICIPETGARFATLAHIWDERRDTWTTRDLNSLRCGTTGYVTDATETTTWDADALTWDSDVSAWNAGSVAAIAHVVTAEANTIYVEDTDDAVSITGTLQRTDMTFGDDVPRVLTQRVHIRGTGLGFSDVRVRLGARHSVDVPIAWGAYVPVEQHGTPYEVEGRYISLEVMATGTDAWTVDRIVLQGRYDGDF